MTSGEIVTVLKNKKLLYSGASTCLYIMLNGLDSKKLERSKQICYLNRVSQLSYRGRDYNKCSKWTCMWETLVSERVKPDMSVRYHDITYITYLDFKIVFSCHVNLSWYII